jgi:RNA polymerase sigma-70 factor (ECF subfamily)
MSVLGIARQKQVNDAPTDEKLARRTMDEESFRAFYEQTARNLRAYIRSMLIDHQNMVDDLLQESYFRFLKADLPGATELAHQKNYLYRIATNLVHDHRRSHKLETLPEELPTASKANSLDHAHDIRRAFDRLKARERAALWLAYVECFDHREIAGILQVGSASIRPMLARARAKFADILRRRGIDK